MNVCLAARYSRREELCRCRESLRSLGYRVTSRWLDDSYALDERGLSTEAGAVERARFAREDYIDVSRAEILISFTEMPHSGNGRAVVMWSSGLRSHLVRGCSWSVPGRTYSTACPKSRSSRIGPPANRCSRVRPGPDSRRDADTSEETISDVAK